MTSYQRQKREIERLRSEKELLTELKKLNQNFALLWKTNPSQFVPNESEWIYIEEAMKLLNRKRSWMRTRMLTPNQVTHPINTNWFLIRGVDWQYEGKLLIFKRDSILRLKSEMIRLGAEV